MPGEPLHTLDNFPYRCPKCGDSVSFPSLRLLRQHLEIEHYQGNPLVKNYDIYGNRLKKEDSPQKISPLFNTYSKEAKELEQRLAIAKETERFHRDQWNKYKYNTVDKNRPSQNDISLATHRTVSLNEPSTNSPRNLVGGLSPNADMFQLSNGTGPPHHGSFRTDREKGRRITEANITEGHVTSRSNDGLWSYTNKELADLRYKIDRLNEQLQFKDSQLKKLTDELMKLTDDRLKVQRQMLDMSKQQDESNSRIAYFEGKLDEKDRLIDEKQNEIMSMSMFLHDLSIKETAAKQRLEDYVGDLLERTEKAESKLKRRDSKAVSQRSQSFKQQSLQEIMHPEEEQDLRSTWEEISSNYADVLGTTTVREPKCTSTPKHPVELCTPLKIPAPVGPKRALFPPQFTRAQAAVVSPTGMSSYSIGEIIDLSSLSDKLEQLEDREPLSRNRLTSSLPFSSKAKTHPGPELSQTQQQPPRNKPHHTGPSTNPMVTLPDGTVNEYSTIGSMRRGQYTAAAAEAQSPYANVSSLKTETPTGSLVKHSMYYNVPAGGEGQRLQREVGVRREGHEGTTRREESDDSEETEEYDTEDEESSEQETIHEEDNRPCSVGEVHLSSRPHRNNKQYSSKHVHDWKNASLKEQRRRESLYCVFMYLDTKTLVTVSEVCKEWRDVSRDPSLWRYVVLANAKISSKYLCTLATWSTQLQVLHLSGLRPRSIRKKESKADYERSIRGCLERGLEELLKGSGNTLISLKIVDCGEIITDRCLWLAGCHSPHLERLAYISDTDPVGVESVYALGAGCRNITTLLVQPHFPNHKPHRFNNKTVHRIAQCWPELRVVCIGGVDVDIRGLTCLAKHCQGLEVLEVDHMREIGEDTARGLCKEGLKKLESLDFKYTPVTPKALLVFSNSCPKLKKINIDIGISDYYEDIFNPVHRENYEEIVYKLKSLRTKPGLKGKLHINSDHG